MNELQVQAEKIGFILNTNKQTKEQLPQFSLYSYQIISDPCIHITSFESQNTDRNKTNDEK